MGDLTEHFSRHELACSHCGEMRFSTVALQHLERLRLDFGSPMRISSGYRCPGHPIEARKEDGPGPHSIVEHDNIAIDVLVYGRRAWWLLWVAMRRVGWTGVGISQTGPHGERFVHLDRAWPEPPHRPRPWIWGY